MTNRKPPIMCVNEIAAPAHVLIGSEILAPENAADFAIICFATSSETFRFAVSVDGLRQVAAQFARAAMVLLALDEPPPGSHEAA